jgi:hypothetical protein
MRVRSLHHTTQASPQALADLLRDCVDGGAASVLVLAGDGVAWPEPVVSPLLRACPVPVFGGVFPEVLHGTRHAADALVVVGLDTPATVHVVPGLDQADADFSAALAPVAPTHETVLVFVDGLAPSIASFIQALFDHVGGGPSFVGGGAGSLSFQQRPCLFTPQGLVGGAALVVGLPGALHIGVDHGWTPVAGPFIVTRTRGTTIEQIDYRPAAEVYRACVEPRVGAVLTPENFFSHAKGFPFGLERFDGSLLVRDPIVMQGDALVCVGEVPEQAVVRVLQGQPDRLLAAASTGAAQALAAAGPALRGALLIDCISRVLFLEQRFGEELHTVQQQLRAAQPESWPLFGALTLGEIANNGQRCLEFYNKTLVLAAFGDG